MNQEFIYFENVHANGVRLYDKISVGVDTEGTLNYMYIIEMDAGINPKTLYKYYYKILPDMDEGEFNLNYLEEVARRGSKFEYLNESIHSCSERIKAKIVHSDP